MRTRHPSEFRQQMVELVRAGRSAKALAQEFEPSEQTIRNWVKQTDLDNGRRTDGLTSEEQAELRRLRRENRQLKLEREILRITAVGLLGRPRRCPSRIRIRESESGQPSGAAALSAAGCLPQRVLRVARPRARAPDASQRAAPDPHPGRFTRVPGRPTALR